MSLLRSMAGGLRSLFRKEQVRQELHEELNGFIREARLERASLEVTKEVVRSERVGILSRRCGRICKTFINSSLEDRQP